MRRGFTGAGKAKKVCPFGDDCFTCTQPDCNADPRQYYNEILTPDVYDSILGAVEE